MLCVCPLFCVQCFKAHNRRKLDSGSNQAEASPALKGSGRHASTSSLRNVDDLLLVLDGLGLEDRKPEGERREKGGRRRRRERERGVEREKEEEKRGEGMREGEGKGERRGEKVGERGRKEGGKGGGRGRGV